MTTTEKAYQHFAKVLTDLLGNDTAIRLTVNRYMPLSLEHIGQSAEGNASSLFLTPRHRS